MPSAEDEPFVASDIDDEMDNRAEDERKLRKLRADRDRSARMDRRRTRDLLAAASIALAVAAVQCGWLSYGKWKVGNDAVATILAILGTATLAGSVILFRKWRCTPRV